MAQRKLPTHFGSMMFKASLALCLIVFAFLQGCVLGNERIGTTLEFTNKGPYSIGVLRFDPDGLRGPVPGALGVGGGAEMSFMPGDSKRGIPQFVEVEWCEPTPASRAQIAEINRRFSKSERLSNEEMAERDSLFKHAYSLANNYTRVIDLTPILTPELLAQVRANRSSTNLKLTVVFQGDNVSITAAPDVWRK
jgi:hypothetical protein